MVESHIGLLFKPLIKTGQTRVLYPLSQFEKGAVKILISYQPLSFTYIRK